MGPFRADIVCRAPRDNFVPVVERLLQAARHGDDEVPCSGADYLHVPEIAIALTLSAGRDHEHVHLPHEDRSLRIFPHPYRMDGGDVRGGSRSVTRGRRAARPVVPRGVPKRN